MNDSVKNAELFPSNYNVVRCDRKFDTVARTMGGGVVAGLINKITYQIIDTAAIGNLVPLIDFIICKCQCSSHILFLVACYIPPQVSLADYELFFEAVEVLLVGQSILLVGDFNLPHFNNLHTNCPKVRSLRSFCDSLQLHQHNSIRNLNNERLDLVFSNLQKIVVSRELHPFVKEDSYHPALSLYVEYPSKSNASFFPSAKTTRYNFRKANFLYLYDDLLSIDWTFLEKCLDVDDALDTFYDHLYNILNCSVPQYAACSHKASYPPWFTPSIISNLKAKDYYRKKWLSSNVDSFFEEYKRLRALCKRQISLSYRDYIMKVENSVRNNPREIFKYLQLKQGTTRIPGKMYQDDVSFETPEEIVNGFAQVFSSIYHPASNVTPNDNCNLPSFKLMCVSDQEVVKIMASFPIKHTAGDDQIPSFLIHDARYALATPLTIIINKAISSSSFPTRWKRARIVPVHKKNDYTQLKNYRPIAILSNFAKVFEQVIYKSIFNHIQPYISPNQHGFLPGRSTITNLITITQFICEQLDNAGQVDVVYTDFSSAFDMVDHGLLLNKLSSFGLAPSFIALIKSYLSNRINYVFYNGFTSYEYVSTSGVPQGSNLGPLFFIVFINDLLRSLTCPVLAYADDLKIYSSVFNDMDVNLLQDNINIIAQYSVSNFLTLNVDKCYFLTFTRKIKSVSSSYNINGHVLLKADSAKDLGVLFDSNLTFINHIESTVSSASKSLGFIMRTSKFFNDFSLLKTLYFSFVLSKLEYACVVWAPYYVCHQLTIEKIQRRFLKYLSFKIDGVYPPRHVDYDNLLRRHNFQSLFSRRKEYGAHFIWKLIHNRLDCSNILSLIKFHVPRLNSRYASTFDFSTPKTNILRRAPLTTMCHDADVFYYDIFNDKM